MYPYHCQIDLLYTFNDGLVFEATIDTAKQQRINVVS